MPLFYIYYNHTGHYSFAYYRFMLRLLIIMGDKESRKSTTITSPGATLATSEMPTTPEGKREWGKGIIRQLTINAFSEKTNWSDPIDTVEKIESNGLYDKEAKFTGVNVNISLNMMVLYTVAHPFLGKGEIKPWIKTRSYR
jgi:hypothetical protein